MHVVRYLMCVMSDYYSFFFHLLFYHNNVNFCNIPQYIDYTRTHAMLSRYNTANNLWVQFGCGFESSNGNLSHGKLLELAIATLQLWCLNSKEKCGCKMASDYVG